MYLTWNTFCLYAILWRCIYSTPVNVSLNLNRNTLARRDIAGPQLGGVNFPDPSIIQVDGIWYSFATRTIGSTVRIQVARSNDFVVWGLIYDQDGSQYDALPHLPPWVYEPDAKTWGPDVQRLADGSFLMYYSASTAAIPRLHCIGVATASMVTGPYIPQEQPIICPTAQGGAIDAAGYEEDGQRYVLYKVDGNANGNGGPSGNTIPPIAPTPIVLQPVASDGYTTQGSAVSLLDNIGPADDGVVEAPNLVRSGNSWVLFFSSGCFVSSKYTVSYATATSLTGPYTRAARPLFRTGDRGLRAPGGMSIWKDGQHMVFHAAFGFGRALYTAKVNIDGGEVKA